MKKKYLFLIIILICFIGCNSEMYALKKIKKSVQKEYGISNKEKIKSLKKREYYTQRQADSARAQEIFKKEYKKTYYEKFNGVILTKDTLYQIEKKDIIEFITHPLIQFGEKQSIIFFDENSDYQLIFEKGLFYPEIFGFESMQIDNMEELGFLSNSPTIKRFSFWLWTYESNGQYWIQLYYFELTNETATKKTNWNSFLENAKLTFLKAGSIII